MTSSVVQLQLVASDKGARLDQTLARHHPDLSRARLQALIAEGLVLVSGRPAKASHRVRGDELVELRLPAPVVAAPQPEDLALKRVYDDADLLVIDKPAGMVVHPGAGHASGTVVNALLHHVKDLQGVGGELRPGIVHRLDKDTSGLLIVAKHDRSLRALQQAFKDRAIEKTYLALVAGQPPEEGSIRTLHARHPSQRLRFTGRVEHGKPAVTHFRVTKRFIDGARVEVIIETGRTHQIRMHLYELGHPLFGDTLYAPRKPPRPGLIARQALHAWKLAFAHPITGKALHFTAPVPPDFKAAERSLASEHADAD